MTVSRLRILAAEPDGLDAQAINILQQAGELVCERCTRARLLAAIGDFDALLVRLNHRIDAELLDVAPRLKAVATATTGLTHVDLDALAVRNISLLSLKGEAAFLNTVTATAELAWGLIIALARRFREVERDIGQGSWDRDRLKGMQLSGQTLGIVGFGRLGRMVAEYATAFRMKVLASDPAVNEYPAGVFPTTLDALLARSDFVTLHVTSDERTRHLIGARELGLMRPSAFLINTSRGEVVDERALIDALTTGRIAGAALDTVEDERGSESPWLSDRPIWRYASAHTNLILSPHVGGATVDSMALAERFIAEKLARFLNGAEAEKRGSFDSVREPS